MRICMRYARAYACYFISVDHFQTHDKTNINPNSLLLRGATKKITTTLIYHAGPLSVLGKLSPLILNELPGLCNHRQYSTHGRRRSIQGQRISLLSSPTENEVFPLNNYYYILTCINNYKLTQYNITKYY